MGVMLVQDLRKSAKWITVDDEIVENPTVLSSIFYRKTSCSWHVRARIKFSAWQSDARAGRRGRDRWVASRQRQVAEKRCS
jgi:hypothetical protein